MTISKPEDILQAFPVRKSAAQKQAFREAAQEYLESLGYRVTVEKGSCRSHNLVAGDPEKAKYLITAHYDTCARMVVPNLITPCNFWLFLGYQILICLLLIVPSLAAGAAAGLLVHNFFVGYFLFLAVLWAMIFLMLIGPANPSNVNDNTSGVVAVLEIARSLPESSRDDVCFVLFDLEEAGLIGSASYRKKHKAASNTQLVLNLDCVGEGDELCLFPAGKLKKSKERMAQLKKLTGSYGNKSITLREKGFAIYPSDQGHFPYGVGICALKRGRVGLYLSKIHTPRDTVLEITNVNLLRAAIISLVGGGAA